MTAAILILAMLQTPAAATPEKIGEIRVHGNAVMSDDNVIALAGVSVGATVGSDEVAAIEKRLRDSGRFDEVQVRKRYRTLEMDEVALLLVVHEKPGVTPSGQPPGVFRTIRSKLMYFPIVGYDAGYGWTYGVRTSIVNAAGRRTAIRVPLAWGANKQAGIEVDRTFDSGPITRATGSFGITQLENPHFDVSDQRTGARGRIERRLFDKLTVGGELARTNVDFGATRDRNWSTTADITLDTRKDPTFPSDAVLTSASWTRLYGIGASSFGASGSNVDTYTLDGRAYKRLFRQNVLALWARYDTASAPLPDYEKRLLDGTWIRGVDSTLYAGDKRFVWSAEVRVPFTAPLDTGKLGFNVFMDGGATAPYGGHILDQREVRSAGAGFWMIFTVIQLNFDVAHSLNGAGNSFHFGTGFTF